MWIWLKAESDLVLVNRGEESLTPVEHDQEESRGHVAQGQLSQETREYYTVHVS